MGKTKKKPWADLHPIFEDCCLPEGWGSGVYALHEPFTKDGFVYATDRRICVRMKTNKTWKPSGKIPDPAQLFALVPENRIVIQLPLVTYQHVVCQECHGTGEGDLNLCGDVAACPHCNGEGGWGDEPMFVRLRGTFAISNQYAALLCRHGVTRVEIRKRWSPKCHHDKLQACYFRVGDDIDGLLMPIEIGFNDDVTEWTPPTLNAPDTMEPDGGSIKGTE